MVRESIQTLVVCCVYVYFWNYNILNFCAIGNSYCDYILVKFDNVEFTRYLLQTYLKKYQYTALNICGMNVESVENIEEHIEKKRRHIEENIEENFVAN